MQTTAERREALLEHINLVKKLPKEGLRITLTPTQTTVAKENPPQQPETRR